MLPYCFALCHWSKKCKSAVYEKENGQEGGYCYQFEKDEEQLDSIEGNQEPFRSEISIWGREGDCIIKNYVESRFFKKSRKKSI